MIYFIIETEAAVISSSMYIEMTIACILLEYFR